MVEDGRQEVLRQLQSGQAFQSLVSLDIMATIRTRDGSPHRSPTKEAPQEFHHVPCNARENPPTDFAPACVSLVPAPTWSTGAPPFLAHLTSFIDKAYSRKPMFGILRFISAGKALVASVVSSLLHGTR